MPHDCKNCGGLGIVRRYVHDGEMWEVIECSRCDGWGWEDSEPRVVNVDDALHQILGDALRKR